MANGGYEYFWMCRRVLSGYRIPQNDFAEVLAEAVFLAYVIQYPLTYALIRYACLHAIRRHCGINKKITLISFSDLDENSWHVFQPEIQESKIVELSKFRRRENIPSENLSDALG